MNLSDIMSRNVEVIGSDRSLLEAAKRMKELDVGGLPVASGDHIDGFITDRDIVVRAIAEGENPNECKVSDVMSPGVTWCYDDITVEDAAKLMEENKIRRLLVMNRDKRLVGIVSLGDLALESGNEALAGHALESISEHGQPQQPSA